MQLDVEESTPASDMTVLFHSRMAIDNCQHAIEFWSSDTRRTDRQTED